MGGPSKVFNDPIHGHIELPELCVKIIDTQYFQRLRNIKQLGTCYLVYPGASHNRFEHSLGVCHLAGKLLKAIKEKQPEKLTEKDILCVQIAAVCHDLGQGPFSHLFEKKFMPCYDKDWKDWPFEGRGKEKAFLYEVVINKSTGIDVDRWDYLGRDSYMLGMKNIFDLNRCIANARVLQVDEMTQICYRDKEAQDIYDMFYTRMTLHRRAYQHKTHNIISRMVCDALKKANDHLTFKGKNGVVYRLKDSVKDMEAFSKVTDDVFYMIYLSDEGQLKESKEIIHNVLNRNLYKCVGQTQIKEAEEQRFDESSFKEKLFEKITAKRTGEKWYRYRCMLVNGQVVKLNYGMDDMDPLKNVRFYTKFNNDVPIPINKDQVSYVLPETFSEKMIRVYCKHPDINHLKIVKESFTEMCDENGYPKPKDR